jgi:8-oxo-dGTP pyrophosphatase MutT (NUDIX family)
MSYGQIMLKPARPAATVAVLRDSERGPEVFLVKRNAKTVFFPHAHVFPGGRVDEEDAEVNVVGGAVDRERMGCENAVAYQAAAIRETYEEAGILLAEGEGTDALRHALHERKEGLGEMASRLGWVLNAENLVYWSWWVTPDVESRRYSARFFVAGIRDGQNAKHDAIETVDSEWITPRDALKKFERGEIFLAPPTHFTLVELQGYSTVKAVLEAGRVRATPAIMPLLRPQENGSLEVLLPGHPDHPSADSVEGVNRFFMDYTPFQNS